MHEIVEALKKLSKDTQTLSKLFSRYEKDSQEPLYNIYVLERQLARIEEMNQAFTECEVKESIKNWIRQQRDYLDSLKDEFRLKFGKDLQAVTSECGWQVRGQYPVLRISWFTLKIDFQFGEATIYFGPEVEKIKSKITLAPDMIIRCLKEFDGELRNLNDDRDRYYLDIHNSYTKALKVNEKEYGDKLLINDVLTEFVMLKQSKKFLIDPQKGNYCEYSRVKLSYILFLIKQSSMKDTILHLHVATFDATTDKRRSLWIPDNDTGDGTYYSYISFEERRD